MEVSVCNSDLRDLGGDRTVKCMESFVCIWNAWTGCSQQSASWTWIFDRVFSCRWGLVFNIGNVGGGALGFNTLLGIPTTVGYFIAGAIAILVFLMKNAMNAMDNLTKVLGGIMILVIFIVILIVQPPVGMAVKETVLPTASMSDIFPAILTLLGGTVGGYITFAGAHRLIDAGITGKEKLKEINKSSVMGMGIATIVRIFLFLAVLGVVVATATSPAHTLDPANPTADAFLQEQDRSDTVSLDL